jgi:high-affinity iron transporter
MIVSFIRRGQAVLLSLLAALSVLALLARPASADAGDSPEIEARRMVHILGYVAADYGVAVSGGAITNADEYTEQIQLLSDAAKIAERIQPSVPSQAAGGERLDLGARVAKVRGLVDAKAEPSEVATAAAEARAAIIGAFKITESPDARPSAARGEGIYLEHCATCHGVTGRADTPRAATFTPRPTNFLDPDVGEGITPFRVASTVRFGVSGTAMVPFTFLSEAQQWDVAYYVAGLRHTAAPASDAPTHTLAELAVRSDAELRAELTAAGVSSDRHDAILAFLRKRAPYEEQPASAPLTVARIKLDRARVAVMRGERDVARSNIIDAYLEGVEPAEPALRAKDAALAAAIEGRFRRLRSALEGGAGPAEITSEISDILRDITRAEAIVEPPGGRSFVSTALSSAGILLREGVEAALLIAALLGLAAQAGLGDRKRYVHMGWGIAIVLGVLTWVVSSKLIAISGAKRELIEGVTALCAMAVLFYVSYSLLAKREVARWMRFLRERVSKRSAAISLLGVSLLAAYREVFETVLFYQALLASNASVTAALVGALVGAVLLVLLVAVYSRAGRFAPPQVFFKVSSYLLYGLAIVFAGQGVAAMQLAGVFPLHPVPGPEIPALGIYPTIETLAAQLLLVALAIVARVVGRSGTASAGRPTGEQGPAGAPSPKDGVASERAA